VCVCMCVYLFVCVHMCACVRACTCVCECVCVFVCVCSCVRVCVCVDRTVRNELIFVQLLPSDIQDFDLNVRPVHMCDMTHSYM